MNGEICCLHCAKPTSDGREFHDSCWPEAKKHFDAVMDMARRKYGFSFGLLVETDDFGNPSIRPLLGGFVEEVVGEPPAQVVGEAFIGEENESNLEALEAQAAAEPEFLDSPCLCEKDTDNRCPKCIDIICAYIGGVVDIQREFWEKQAKLKAPEEGCEACGRQYADYCLAKMVKELFSKMLDMTGREFTKPILSLIEIMRTQFARKGIRKWPLLDKATRELTEPQDPFLRAP